MSGFKAKRVAPILEPLTLNGIRYDELSHSRVHGFAQTGGVLSAEDINTGEILWNLQLWETDYSSGWETDILDIFITKFQTEADGRLLRIFGQRGHEVLLDLQRREIIERKSPQKRD